MFETELILKTVIKACMKTFYDLNMKKCRIYVMYAGKKIISKLQHTAFNYILCERQEILVYKNYC